MGSCPLSRCESGRVPYALRAVSDDEYAVLRECDVSYFEVTIGEPPARDDDFVPQPECVAVGLASAKVRAQIRKSFCAALARRPRARPPQFPTHGRQPGWDGSFVATCINHSMFPINFNSQFSILNSMNL